MKIADSDATKETRDAILLFWRIMNHAGEAKVYALKIPQNVIQIPYTPLAVVTNEILEGFLTDHYVWDGKNYWPQVDNQGFYETSKLTCQTTQKGFYVRDIYNDQGEQLCFFPNDINNDGKAIVNEVVQISLGGMNYKLSNFQGGYIKHSLLNHIRVTPDGYVTLPGIPDPVQV